MQEKQLALVTYEQAKKLKELGFDWDCPDVVTDGGWVYNAPDLVYRTDKEFLPAPTVALALKWLRDVKGIVNGIKRENIDDCDLIEYCGHFNDMYITDFTYTYYEEAESALLDALLEHCEQEVKNA